MYARDDPYRKRLKAIYDGKDVFVWLLTVFGKSVCFQALPLVFDYKLGLCNIQKKSIVVVVAPWLP